MTTSEAINELAAALSKAQAAMKGAAKDSENPHFRSKYADLASVRDACWKPLTDHGLSVVQSPRLVGSEQGYVVELETRLMHSSGQWMADVAATPIQKTDAQGVGSAVTYLRRYALAAFAGIAPEDDDGNAASESHAPAQAPRAPAPSHDAAGTPHDLRIRTVTQKTISGGRLQWTVTFSDGVVATTINERLAMKADNACTDKSVVTRELEQKGRFTNLTGLHVTSDAPANAPLPMPDDDIPVISDNDIPF